MLGFQRPDKAGGGEGKEAVSTLSLELLCIGTEVYDLIINLV